MGDDLEGVLTSQVQGGEDGQETLGGEQEEYGHEEVRRTATVSSAISLIMNRTIRLLSVDCIAVIAYCLPLKQIPDKLLWPPNRVHRRRKPGGVELIGDHPDSLQHRWSWPLHSSGTWPGPGRRRRRRGRR